MSNPQAELQKAYELIKQGENRQALMILRGVLENDKNNADAWWLYANAADNQERVEKALNRVLEINPNHTDAQKRLAALTGTELQKPKMSGTGYVINEADLAAKQKRIDKNRAAKEGQSGNVLVNIGKRMGMRLVFGIFALLIFGGYQLFVNANLTDSNGNEPTDIALAFERAYWEEDYNTMMKLVCDGYEWYVDELWVDTYAYNNGSVPDDLTVDISQLTTEYLRKNPNQTTVQFHGTVRWTAYGEELSYNFDEENAAAAANDSEYDWYWSGHHVNRINGEWKICDGPDVISQ